MSRRLKRLALASCRPFNQQRNGLPRNLLFHHAPPFVFLHNGILWNTCYTSQSAFYIICFSCFYVTKFCPKPQTFVHMFSFCREMGYRAYEIEGASALLYRPFVSVYFGAAYLKWLSTYDGK